MKLRKIRWKGSSKRTYPARKYMWRRYRVKISPTGAHHSTFWAKEWEII